MENKVVNEIIELLSRDQNLIKNEIDESVAYNREASETMAIYGLFQAFVNQAEKTNWKSLMDNIEGILGSTSMAEHWVLVEQYILEGFSHAVDSETLDPKFLREFAGPLAKDYIEGYERAMGGTRTF